MVISIYCNNLAISLLLYNLFICSYILTNHNIIYNIALFLTACLVLLMMIELLPKVDTTIDLGDLLLLPVNDI